MAILVQCPFCRRKQSTNNKKCKCGEDLDKLKRSKRVRYWINYRMPGGKQRREPVGTFEGLNAFSITDAKEALSKRMVQKREKRIFEMQPETNMTFSELAEWFLSLGKVKSKAYYGTLKINLASFNAIFSNIIVSEIKPVDLENYQATRKKKGLSDSYIDQEIGAARTMVIKAFDNDKIGGDALKPFRKCERLLKKKNANARDMVLPYEEYKKLMAALPHHLKAIVSTGFYTGMRRGEVLKLTWDKVDLKKRIIKLEPEDTKEKEAKKVPIAKPLRDMLMMLPSRPKTQNKGYAFLYIGKPVSDIREGLRRACRDADIPYGRNVKDGFTFHDLRHGFATHMRKAGVARNVIMVIMGHSGNDMNFRYDSVDETDLIKAIDQLEVFLESVDHSVDQVEKNKSDALAKHYK